MTSRARMFSPLSVFDSRPRDGQHAKHHHESESARTNRVTDGAGLHCSKGKDAQKGRKEKTDSQESESEQHVRHLWKAGDVPRAPSVVQAPGATT